MNPTTLVTVRPRGRSKAPVRYVVAGVYGTGRQSFTDYAEAEAYSMRLAYGTADLYTLVG